MKNAFRTEQAQPRGKRWRLPALPTRGRLGLSPGSGNPLESKVTSSTLVLTAIPAGVDSGEGSGMASQAGSHPCPRPLSGVPTE